MRRTKEGLAPFEDDKHKIAENTDFEAHPDNSPIAMLGDAKNGNPQRKLIIAIFTANFTCLCLLRYP